MKDRSVAVRETANATKERYGPEDLGELLQGARRIVVAKGKKVLTFEASGAGPASEEVAAAVIGPSGNLRAPTLRTGTTWHVGFNEDAYAAHFG